jgi:SMODS-associated and fused to various effectors sensor domain
MASSIRPVILGLDYQARWFWLEGARLLRAEPVLTSIGFELARYGRAFDDVVSRPIRPDLNSWGQPVDVDCYQAKFKVDHVKRITAAALTDPTFINATRFSLLQRLRLAQRIFADTGLRGRYTIVTPWQIHPDDTLSVLTSTNGELNLDRLFSGGPKSATGTVREQWRSHLRLTTETELRTTLEPFRLLVYGPDQVDRLLESALDSVRLSLVPTGSVRHPYVDLAHGFVKTRQREFDEPALRRVLDAEGLWRPTALDPPPGRPLAIRSRRPYAAHLEDETENLLDLVPLFHARSIMTGVNWDTDVAPRIAAFLEARVQPNETYRLYLDAHNAIAFAAGWDLAHSGANVIPMQRTGPAVVPWPSIGPTPRGRLWEPWEQDMPSAGPDIALALGVTQNVRADVEAYVSSRLPSVGRIVGMSVPAISGTSVRDGAHAFGLARTAVEYVAAVRKPGERGGRVHLFAAAPNGLIFFLGRLGRGLGPTVVYEYDFDTRALGSYVPAISLPPST